MPYFTCKTSQNFLTDMTFIDRHILTFTIYINPVLDVRPSYIPQQEITVYQQQSIPLVSYLPRFEGTVTHTTQSLIVSLPEENENLRYEKHAHKQNATKQNEKSSNVLHKVRSRALFRHFPFVCSHSGRGRPKISPPENGNCDCNLGTSLKRSLKNTFRNTSGN